MNTNGDVLQHLGVDSLKRGAFLLQYRKGLLLLIERQTLATLLVRGFAPFQQMVIEPATFFKRLVEVPSLLLCWIDPILKGFTHAYIIAQIRTHV